MNHDKKNKTRREEAFKALELYPTKPSFFRFASPSIVSLSFWKKNQHLNSPLFLLTLDPKIDPLFLSFCFPFFSSLIFFFNLFHLFLAAIYSQTKVESSRAVLTGSWGWHAAAGKQLQGVKRIVLYGEGWARGELDM